MPPFHMMLTLLDPRVTGLSTLSHPLICTTMNKTWTPSTNGQLSYPAEAKAATQQTWTALMNGPVISGQTAWRGKRSFTALGGDSIEEKKLA